MARRFAYLTPDTNETQTIVSRCLSVPLPLLPHVIGALSELTNVWRWEQFGTMTPEDAAQLAAVMLNGFSGDCGLDCSGVLTCLQDSGFALTPAKRLRVVSGVPSWSYDGEAWTDYLDSPSQQPIVPSPVEVPGGTDEAKKCLGATRAALVIAEFYKQTYGVLTASIGNFLLSLNTFFYDVNYTLLGLTYGEAAQVVYADMIRDDYDSLYYETPELSSQNIEDLTCLLLDNATVTDGIVTFSKSAVLSEIVGALGLNPALALSTLIGYMNDAGLNHAATVAITDTADCTPCESVNVMMLEIQPDGQQLGDWVLTYDEINDMYSYSGSNPIFDGNEWYYPTIRRVDGGCFYVQNFGQTGGHVWDYYNFGNICGVGWNTNVNRHMNNQPVSHVRWQAQTAGPNTITFRAALI